MPASDAPMPCGADIMVVPAPDQPVEVLVTAPSMVPLVYERLEKSFKVYRLWEVEDRQSWLAENGPKISGLVTAYNVGANQELIEALPSLQIISCYGVGVDAIDLQCAHRRGVVVTNTPAVLTDETADTGFMLLLATARRLVQADRFVRSGQWTKSDFPLTTSVSVGGKRVGIVGLGDIGQAFASRAAAFNCEVVYNGRREKPGVLYRFYADLEEMAGEVDFLVLTCPGGPATRHIVGRKVLDALGPKGILINVARGTVVDQPELIAALKEGRLGGAGLDVFESEPHVPEDLAALDNVVLLPHVGSATVETRNSMANLTVDNVMLHFRGEGVLTPVQ